jgi:hypothetical protein
MRSNQEGIGGARATVEEGQQRGVPTGVAETIPSTEAIA